MEGVSPVGTDYDGGCGGSRGKNRGMNGARSSAKSSARNGAKSSGENKPKRDAGEFFRSKCLRKLQELGAPISGWECEGVEDLLKKSGVGVYASCDLCGNEKVRYLHYMEHPDYDSHLCVGCICAGILEGDELAAKKRERDFKNRAKRKNTFLNRKWRVYKVAGYANPNIKTLRYRGSEIFIRTVVLKRPVTSVASGKSASHLTLCKVLPKQYERCRCYEHNKYYEAVVNGDVLRRSEGAYFESFDEAVAAVFEKVESTNATVLG